MYYVTLCYSKLAKGDFCFNHNVVGAWINDKRWKKEQVRASFSVHWTVGHKKQTQKIKRRDSSHSQECGATVRRELLQRIIFSNEEAIFIN
jgi:hypothetical protein